MDNRTRVWELEESISKQAARNKTLRKAELQELIIRKLNAVNKTSNDAEFLDGYNRAMMSLLHTLDCYRGYNARGWIAFCQHANWHSIVKAIQTADDQSGTKHYWTLLDILERRMPGNHYYGADSFEPTWKEKQQARKIAQRYARVLGV